ncbi:MAG: DinB family protein [Streptosporangiaceae bacterium]
MAEQLPERTFGWSNMFVATRESDPREQGGPPVGERDLLARFLRDYRLTLELKCEGLDAEAMAARSVPPSDLSLLGLVRHLAAVEQFWFRRVLAGQDVPRLYRSADGRNESFEGAIADPAVVAEAWDAWRGEVAFAELLVADLHDLGARSTFDNGLGEQDSISVRELLVHMIEEYARHMGHADFLRERIDGRVGQ